MHLHTCQYPWSLRLDLFLFGGFHKDYKEMRQRPNYFFKQLQPQFVQVWTVQGHLPSLQGPNTEVSMWLKISECWMNEWIQDSHCVAYSTKEILLHLLCVFGHCSKVLICFFRIKDTEEEHRPTGWVCTSKGLCFWQGHRKSRPGLFGSREQVLLY